MELKENIDLAEKALIKYKANNSTLFFTRYFFKQKTGRKFVIGEHHRIISEALDKVLKGEITRLIINIAPRYGKTELAVKNFIARGLALNPSARFIHLSYSDDLALDNSDEVRELVKHEDFQSLYPNVKIKPNSDSKKKWYTTANGGVYATSAAGQVTGFGAGRVDDEDAELIPGSTDQFAGALIIDDPIKPEDGDSEVLRERINQRFDSTIKNRVNSRKTPIIIIMQRIHERDLCGYLIEQNPGEWTVLSLPCIKPDGTALWEFKHTVAELNKIRKDSPVVFERQYQQDPKPLKGLLFPIDKQLCDYYTEIGPDGKEKRVECVKFYKPSELIDKTFETSIGYCDIADEGSDNLASPIGRNIGPVIYVPEVIFSTENTDTTMPMVAEMLKSNKAEYCRVESNNMGAMFGRTLQSLVPNTQVLLINNSRNKHTRILVESAFILKHFRFVHPDYQTEPYKLFMKQLGNYMKEIKTQPKDDAPDSLAGLSLFIRNFLSHLYI